MGRLAQILLLAGLAPSLSVAIRSFQDLPGLREAWRFSPPGRSGVPCHRC